MKRAMAGLIGLLVILIVSYLFYVAKQIERQSNRDEAQRADIIIVLGAAEYHGRPSPAQSCALVISARTGSLRSDNGRSRR